MLAMHSITMRCAVGTSAMNASANAEMRNKAVKEGIGGKGRM
jgi:hypothetical protein